jgi:hypothetical protein
MFAQFKHNLCALERISYLLEWVAMCHPGATGAEADYPDKKQVGSLVAPQQIGRPQSARRADDKHYDVAMRQDQKTNWASIVSDHKSLLMRMISRYCAYC